MERKCNISWWTAIQRRLQTNSFETRVALKDKKPRGKTCHASIYSKNVN